MGNLYRVPLLFVQCMRAFWIILLVGLSVITMGEGFYVRATASETAKRLCAHEPVDFFLKSQYTNCLRRQ